MSLEVNGEAKGDAAAKTRRRAIVLTRAEPQNSEFAELLRECVETSENRNIEIIEMPLSRYVALNPIIPDLSGFDMGIVTSKAAIEYFQPDVSAIDWMVVGKQAKRALEERGAKVLAHFENADALMAALPLSLAERFVYLRGEVINKDLKKALDKNRQRLDEFVVYKRVPVDPPQEQLALLKNYDELVFPVFSKQSYFPLQGVFDALKNSARISYVPISESVANLIREDLAFSLQNFAVETPPSRPDRAGFLIKIQELLAQKPK